LRDPASNPRTERRCRRIAFTQKRTPASGNLPGFRSQSTGGVRRAEKCPFVGMENASERIEFMVNMNDRAGISGPALFFAVLVAAGLLAYPTRLQAAVPRGVFSLVPNDGTPANDIVLANPDVAGISIRYGWLGLEPTEGVYNWTFLDSEVARAAAAGKSVLLRIVTQAGKPQWVTDAVTNAGGLFFTFDNNGVTTSIPVFWDPTYLAKKKAMIAALGAHFASNPTVKIVSASFANSTSEDWSVPHTSDAVAKWLSLGYTSEKMLDAGKQIIDATMTAFPNAYATLAINGNGHVNGLNLDPDADYVSRNAILAASISWPGRLIVQKNSVSTVIAAAPGTGGNFEVLWNNRPNVAGQMLFWCSNDSTYRMNGGVPGDPATILHNAINAGYSYGMQYLEIYQTDVLNLPAEITYAHNLLVNSPTPTPTPSATPPNVPTGFEVVP